MPSTTLRSRLNALTSHEVQRETKVPHVALAFWAIKLLTTGMGEAMSDFIASFPAILAVVTVGILFALFCWIFLRQIRAVSYHAVRYWCVVAEIAIFGTMAADVVHVILGNTLTTLLYLLAVIGVLMAWHRSEGSISIHSITTPRRELFYWATVAATFALGTALGDFASDTLHLGYGDGALVFAILMAVVAIAWMALKTPPVPTFWTAYILTRPLGASVADWLGKPAPKGLAWGDNAVSGIALLLFVSALAWLARSGRDTPRG